MSSTMDHINVLHCQYPIAMARAALTYKKEKKEKNTEKKKNERKPKKETWVLVSVRRLIGCDVMVIYI